MWGGQVDWTFDKFPQLEAAYVNFANNAPTDQDAAFAINFIYSQASQQFVAVAALEYATPVANPPIFDELLAIPNIKSTMRITTMFNLSVESNQDSPYGFRSVIRSCHSPRKLISLSY
jgi:hypothetical protein